MNDFRTDAEITWCPGCGNFQILNAVEFLLKELKENDFPLEKLILVSGVGNHAKIVDYLHINSFNALHGRAIPAAAAIKATDPDNKVICFVGDGDSYAEGLEHFVFAAKRNADITVVVHNNRTYGLATGQFTPTSQSSFTGVTMPDGAKEDAFNPLELLLVSGATFIARSYPKNRDHFRNVLQEAFWHKGFSVVDALQVCVTFNNLYENYDEHVQETAADDLKDFDLALKTIRKWDYKTLDKKIPVGIFYREEVPVFEEKYLRLKENRKAKSQYKKRFVKQHLDAQKE